MTLKARRANPTTVLVPLLLSLSVITVEAVQVGPRMQPAPTVLEDTTKPLKSRMNIPSLSLAIPILDPGIPRSTEEQRNKGIWPELRQTEAVRSAFHLRKEILRYNQFDSIVVTPDASVSADVYLLASIVESTSEVTRISFLIADSTGKEWTKRATVRHRVELGWHERYGGQGVDPFQPLYAEIAGRVYEALKTKGKAHVEHLERHNKRRSDELAPMSELQRIVAVRKLALARFFAPVQFGDTLEIKSGMYRLNYVPDMTSAEWARIESVVAREHSVVTQLDGYYEDFLEQIEEPYTQWQKDTFPIAREVRLRKRSAAIKGIAGTALLVLSVAASQDGAAADGDGSAQLATKAGALAGGALIVSSFVDNSARKGAVGMINEVGRNMHTTLRPTRVELADRVVLLQGTAQEQFAQWRSLLAELYEDETADLDAINIVKGS